MSRTGALILIGILVILTPFSGFPIGLRSILLVVLGLMVLSIGLSLRRSEVQKAESDIVAHSSSESHNLSVG